MEYNRQGRAHETVQRTQAQKPPRAAPLNASGEERIVVTREDLHRLVDELPESNRETAFRILECLRGEKRGQLVEALAESPTDPFLQALTAAPIDDEPETPEEAAAVQEAVNASARGEVVSWEEAKRRLLGDGA